jgi:hypothetical protein
MIPQKQGNPALNVLMLVIVATAALLSSKAAISAPDAPSAAAPSCSISSFRMYSACSHGAADNFWVSAAICQNVADRADRRDCESEMHDTYKSDLTLCRAQRVVRMNACKDLGQSPYDPQIDPVNFVDPLEIGTSVVANPYLILTPGYTRVYNSPTEVITITVTHDTAVILGVTCIVSRDTARDPDGNLIEDTVDYFAQDVTGNVWYFGETTAEYEGGLPVSVEGTFKAGVERAKPGIAMLAVLPSGQLYREEFALGTAEDMARVISTTASESAPAASCRASCLQTDNFTPIAPSAGETKYYAPGIGEIVAFPASDPTQREVLVSYHY